MISLLPERREDIVRSTVSASSMIFVIPRGRFYNLSRVRRRRCLSRAFAKYNHFNGLQQNQQVKDEPVVLDVEQIVLEFFQRILIGRAVGVAQLRPPGNAGFDRMSLRIIRDLLAETANERGSLGPRPDEAHFPREYIEQLRQLVEPGLADNGAHSRHA